MASPIAADTGFSNTLRVSETDNSPACTVGQIKVTAGTLTCNGQVATISTGGGSGGLPLPGGATNYIWNSDTLQTGATAYPEFIYASTGTFSQSLNLGDPITGGSGDMVFKITGAGISNGKAIVQYSHCIFGFCSALWKTGTLDILTLNYGIYSLASDSTPFEIENTSGNKVKVMGTDGLYVDNNLQVGNVVVVTSTATITSYDHEFSISSTGPVLTDSDGCRWRTTVTTAGNLVTTSIGCPTVVASRPCRRGMSLGLMLAITCP